MQCQRQHIGDIISHNSRVNIARMFKLGRVVDHVTCHMKPWSKVRRTKANVRRSHDVSAERMIYCL